MEEQSDEDMAIVAVNGSIDARERQELASVDRQEADVGKKSEAAREMNGGDEDVPTLGMTFQTPEEAFRFYDKYARRTGFGIKVLNSTYYEDGRCRYLWLSCNKDGKVKYKTDFHSSKPSKKTNCMARIQLRHRADGLLHIKQVILDHNHPLSPGTAKSYHTRKRKRFLENDDGGGMQLDWSLPGGFGRIRKRGTGEKKCELRLEKGDGEAIHRFFIGMQTKDSYFFHSMDLDEEGRLRNVFWADGRSRTAYQYFGDVILFDTTYLIDKYDVPLVSFVGVNHHGQKVLLGCGLLSDESSETYIWLFKTWLSCMFGCPPIAIITDRCNALREAVAVVFPKACHRQCLWHIMKRIPENLQGYVDHKEIKKTLKKVMYDSLRTKEFEEDWKKMVEKYKLENNEWLNLLYEDHRYWAPVFVKDTFWAGLSLTRRGESMKSFFDEYVHYKITLRQFLRKYELVVQSKYEKEVQADIELFHKSPQLITQFYMEEQIGKVYTFEMFKKFQAEIRALIYCVSSLVKVDGQVYTFEVKERIRVKDSKNMENNFYEVLYNENESEVRCICCSFQFRGILCRHALSVLNFQNVIEIPSKYILERWRKDFKRMHALACFPDEVVADGSLERHGNFYKHCLKLSEIGLMSDEKYEFALKVVNEAIQKLLANDSTCGGAQTENASHEALSNCNMVDFNLNGGRNRGIESNGFHNQVQVRQTVNHPHFEFFQDRGHNEQQLAGYRSGMDWGFQQYFQEGQTQETNPSPRPW